MMTEQPKYYLITSEELDMVRNQNHYWAERTLNTVLSRPAPSPSEQCNAKSFRAIIEQNRKEAASHAREKFAKTIRRKLSKLKSNNGSASDFVWWEVIDVAINEVNESLRVGGKQRTGPTTGMVGDA